MSDRTGFRIAQIGVLLLSVAGMLGVLVVYSGCGLRRARVTDCANHLSQLNKLLCNYSPTGKPPTAVGEDLWLSFRKCNPLLIEVDQIEILFCSVKGDRPTDGSTDYRGPTCPVKKLLAGNPLGADKPGNHGHKYGGNVLRMDGSVTERGLDDPEWRRCESLLKP